MNSLNRALRILVKIAHSPMSVTDVTNYFSITKSTASRVLTVMAKEGFLQLNRERKYIIGPTVYTLINGSHENLNIQEVARPFLLILNQETSETIHLAIMTNESITYIDKLDAKRTVRMHSSIGSTNPTYCTGVGKILLAGMNKAKLEVYLSKIKLIPYTKKTIIEKEKLKNELELIKKSGISIDRCEHDELIRCIAAPIVDFNNNIIAGVSISVPVAYVTEAKLLSYKAKLLKCVKDISERIGYIGEWAPFG